MSEIFKKIFEFVKTLEIIDTHEHLPLNENERDKNTDVLREYLIHYFSSDLISAGLSKADFLKVIDVKKSIIERWNIVEPHWKAAKYTGYGRALEISAKELYGIDEISSKTIEKLNKEFLKSLKQDHFQKVLKEKCKIKISLLDSEQVLSKAITCDQHFFRTIYKIDDWVYPNTQKKFKQLEEQSGIKINSFENYLDAYKIVFKEAFKSNVIALKNSLAYERTLDYEKIKESEAKKVFNQFINNKSPFPANIAKHGKKFQDFMMHYILNIADKNKTVFQFHTGIQEGNGNILSNSDPSLLSNIFLEYPNVKFDVFHIGYPYHNILAALAKVFPNVYIDMCWSHIVSPNASVNALVEFIDTVPINKISAFGGDYCFIDGVYGHQYLARINVSKALARKVEEGVLNIQEAKEIAEMIFFKNPNELFSLNL